MTNAQATTYLRSHMACAWSLEWFGDRDPRIAWETCVRPDWMEWIARECGLWTDATRDAFYAADKPARDTYVAAVKLAWDTDYAAVKLAWDTYVAAVKLARDAYDEAVKPARDTYDAAVKLARDTYDAVVNPAWDTYDAAVKPARDTYDAVCCDAIRSLVPFDEIARAIEKEEAQ